MNTTPEQQAIPQNHSLFLLNDDVNDMLYVVNCLSEIMDFEVNDCVTKMLEAHEQGKVFLKVGNIEELTLLKDTFEARNLGVSIE